MSFELFNDPAALAGRLHWFGTAPRFWETLRKVA